VPYSAVWVLILHFACRHFAGTFSKKICGPRHKNKLSTPVYQYILVFWYDGILEQTVITVKKNDSRYNVIHAYFVPSY
jgi:hypothetical protein